MENDLRDLGFGKDLYREGSLMSSAPFSELSSPTVQNPITEGIPSSQVIAGDFYQVLFAGKNSFTDTTSGYRMGLDGSSYKWIIGGSSSSADWNVTTADTFTIDGTLSASTIIGGSIHIPDRDTTTNSFHVDSSGNAWWGATETSFTASNKNANAYVLSTGAAYFESVTIANSSTSESLGFLTFDTTNGFVSRGKSITQQNYTTGHAIDQGDAVARESGAIYRTRVNNYSAEGTATTMTINPFNAGTTNKYGRLLNFTQTVKIGIAATGNTTNDITAFRIVCSPSSSSITSATATVAINTAANIDVDADICVLDSTRAVAVYTDAAGGAIYAQVLSGLDTTLTLNTEATVAAASNDRCAVVQVSGTEVLVIYTDGSDNIVATSLTIDGLNAITVGATQTLLSDANVLQVRWAERFASTTAHCVAFYDSTNTISYVLAFTYSGGSYSIGSATSVVSSLVRPSMASMSDTAMIYVGSARSHGITRSGTTLTVGSNTAIGAGNFMYVARMGKGNAVVAWRNAVADVRYQAVDMDTTSRAITLLGSAGSIDTTGGDDFIPMIVKLSPTRAVVFRDGTVSNDEKVVVAEWSTNFDQFLGIAAASGATATSLLVVEAGESDDVTSGTDGTTAYLDGGGGLTTTALGGSVKIGVFTGTTTISVKG